MIDREEAEHALARQLPLHTKDGDDLGPIRGVFLDEYTGRPSFATITLGPNPNQETFVALHEAEVHTDKIEVPYSLEKIYGAISMGDTESLSTAQEDDLFDYYGVPIDGVAPIVEHLGSALVPARRTRGGGTNRSILRPNTTLTSPTKSQKLIPHISRLI